MGGVAQSCGADMIQNNSYRTMFLNLFKISPFPGEKTSFKFLLNKKNETLMNIFVR